MAVEIGRVLRSLREAAGISIRSLAERTHYSKSEISYVERGERVAHPSLAAACDQVLGTAPLLTTLLELSGQDHAIRCRVLLNEITAATGIAGVSGAATVAELIRHSLLDAAGEPEDWPQVVADMSRCLVVDPSPAFGAALLGQVMLCKHLIVDAGATPERLRAAALLGQLYGLWKGNQHEIPAARGWYRTAAMLADRSGDTAAQAFVKARAASRGIFEGYTLAEVDTRAKEALAISARPSLGTLEAHSALVNVQALAGDLTGGRRALTKMLEVAERLPVTGPDSPTARALSFAHYLESRLGTSASADRAWEQAEPVLQPLPVWWREAQVYYGLSLVRRGDVNDGLSYALQAVNALPSPVHTVGIGVADLLREVPADHRSYELDELRIHAATGDGPWTVPSRVREGATGIRRSRPSRRTECGRLPKR
ncbi:helix-turn-helix domain-containing protein [Salinispora arenicola]|uniref:helix-turn-helix domain-containing protein n=1 Tax=Salinispora arenicola TaxID=168697 RepID=UPI0009B7687C|nr:helix-turn-helix transcriptional regulator [Salinispora arenicola]